MKMPSNVMGLYGFEPSQGDQQTDQSGDMTDMMNLQNFYAPAQMGMAGGMGMGGYARGGGVDDPMAAARRVAFGSGGHFDTGFDYKPSMQLYFDLINSGKMTPQAAAGYAGNFSHESKNAGHMNYGAMEQGANPGVAGIGAAQWTNNKVHGHIDPNHGRRTDLMNFANANNKPWQDPSLQHDFFNHERQNNPWVRSQDLKVQASPNIDSATANVAKYYERPNAAALHSSMPARQAFAHGVDDRASGWTKGTIFENYQTPNTSQNVVNQIKADIPHSAPSHGLTPNKPPEFPVSPPGHPSPPARPEEVGPSNIHWKPPLEIQHQTPDPDFNVQFAPEQHSALPEAVHMADATSPISGPGFEEVFAVWRGGSIPRSGFGEGGVPEDEDQAHRFVQGQLHSGEPQVPQYVAENDFPSRAARGVEAVDHYAGALNNALASGAGMSPAFYRPEGRSAGQIVGDALPQDPNQVSKDAVARLRSGDYVGAGETALAGLPETGAIRAYHGSGALFDRFDNNKIGSGVGATMRGHGHYFAGEEPIAREYRDGQSQFVVGVDGKPLPEGTPDIVKMAAKFSPNADDYIGALNKQRASLAERGRLLDFSGEDGELERMLHDANVHSVEERLRALEPFAGKRFHSVSNGHMYEVDLHTDQNRLLDWDKPYHRQSDYVRGVLDDLRVPVTMRDPFGEPHEIPTRGYLAYGHLGADSSGRSSQRLGSQRLKEAGIDGITYADDLTNVMNKPLNASDNVRNYVMFDPNLIEILRRYANGGVVGRDGFADGGHVEEERREVSLPMLASTPSAVDNSMQAGRSADLPSSNASDFIARQLHNGEPQLPQSDQEAGINTAKRMALGAYGLTNIGGAQEALGYMPKAEGGYENSAWQDAREGHYGEAALKAMGAVVPAAGKLGKLGKLAEEAADVTRVADKAADAGKAAEGASGLWTPAAPQIIRSGQAGSGTVGDLLAANGYTNIPDKSYVHWRGVMDEPANAIGQADLYREFNDALKHHLSLPEGMRRANTREAMQAAIPYLGQTAKGTPSDLLTQNEKLAKASQELGVTNRNGNMVDTWGLSLSPAFNAELLRVCGNDAVCKALCLGKKSGGYALEGAMNDPYQINLPRSNSLGRTLFMLQRPREFAVRTADEMRALQAEAAKNGLDLGMRMNTLSDLHPTTWSPFREAFPDVDFYDYTKHNVNPQGANHHLTYSSTGHSSEGLINPHSNFTKMIDRLDRGDNVAMVMNQKNEKPQFLEYLGKKYEVRSGDTHDFRPADKQEKGKPGVVIALGKKEQGKGATAEQARERSKGFYFDYYPKKHGDTISVPDQRTFAAAEKAERAKLKKSGGGSVEHLFHADLYPNSHHYVHAKPGENKIPNVLDRKGSARKRG